MPVAPGFTPFNDIRLDTKSLLKANRILPPCWAQHTYILRPGPFHFNSFRRVLAEDLSVHRVGLSAGARFVGRLDGDAVHIGIYRIPTGRFMHVPTGPSDVGGITLSGGLWEAVVDTESDGVMLLAQGALARRLLDVAREHKLQCSESAGTERDSFVLPSSPVTRQLEQRLKEALETTERSRLLSISRELPELIQRLLPNIQPLAAVLPKPRSQRRQMALQFEQRIWDSLPLRDSMPDLVLETCRTLGLTQRSLQLAVQEHFGLSATALHRTIRLNYAQHLLSDPNGARNVTEAALAAGFSHMGRFSRDYRNLFGEHPSRTLASKLV